MMKKNVFFFMSVILLIFLLVGCLNDSEIPGQTTNPDTSYLLSELSGHYELCDLTDYGVWYLRLEKKPFESTVHNGKFIKVEGEFFPVEQNKVKTDYLFVLIPEHLSNKAIERAEFVSASSVQRTGNQNRKHSIEHLIIRKEQAENGTDLYVLSLSDYIQLKEDKTSFIYMDSILLRPDYVLSNEGNCYQFRYYIDARQACNTHDVDGAFDFLNNLNDPETYIFFGNPNRICLKSDGTIEKQAPDSRKRLRTLGSFGNLNEGNFYNIEKDDQNSLFKITVNLDKLPADYLKKTFYSIFLKGATECTFIEKPTPNIIETTVSYDVADNLQIIKNARFFGFMFMLTDAQGTLKGYYETLSSAADAATDTDRIIVGTNSIVSEEKQTQINDKELSILPKTVDSFTLDYTSSATRSLFITGKASVTLKNAVIKNCSINADGGAILITNGIDPVLTIEHSSFEVNRAANGGAICNKSGIVSISHTTFISNNASGNGGALCNESLLTVKDSELNLNTATGTASKGNGIYNEGNLYFFNNTLDRNTTSTTPEALYITHSGTVYNSSSSEWNRFNAPTVDLSFIENTSSAENSYSNQGTAEGCNITYEISITPQGTLTLKPVQGEEEDTVSLRLDFLTACAFRHGQLTFTAPVGFEITDEASVIVDSIQYPASDYSPQSQLITVDALTIDESSTVTLLLKEQEIPAAYASARLITKQYEFKASSDADGSEAAFSCSAESTTVFTATGLSRNTDFHLDTTGVEMKLKLITNPATSIKISSGTTPAELTARLSSVDGKTQSYTLYNTAGVIAENTPITSDATLTVTPPKGSTYEKDFSVEINPNPFVLLTQTDETITWHESIQDTIDSATEGSTITLYEGIYRESITLGTHNVHLVSTDPLSDSVRTNTVIEGTSKAAITINGGQDNHTLIMGLSIKGNINGSGIKIGDANPIIKANWIAQNQAQKGAGIMIDTTVPSSGRTGDMTIIENNLIESNTADYGGGIYVGNGRNPQITKNELKNNSATTNGGGIYVAEGGTIQNAVGTKWKAHQLPGTTADAKQIEGVETTNTYTSNKINTDAAADNSQLYYTRTDTSHLTKWIAHDKLNCIRLYGTFSAGDIMRLFDSSTSLSAIESTVYASGDYMNIDRNVTSSGNYYVTLQDGATEVYAQSSKRRASIVNTPTSAPELLSPSNNAVELIKPVTLKWDGHTGDASYKIYYGTNPNALDTIKSCQETEYTLNSLTTNTTYYWKVEAVDQYGATLSSTTRNFKTLPFEGGRGTEFNPYQVKTAAQLNTVREYPSCYFKQIANINLSAYSNWDPIDPFTGEYDGQDYVISNLKINSNADNLGLFGGTSKAKLQDMIVTNIDIRGGRLIKVNCGGLVGMATATNIVNCHTSGTINTSNHDNIGGLVGYFYGYTDNTGSISLSHSDCTVTSRYVVGGLVGRFGGKVSIDRCFATGSVTASGDVGGLIGIYESARIVENSYARGDVKSTTNSGQIGGLIGRINDGDNVSDCYSTGKITSASSNYTGGFVGRYYGAGIYRCYWNKETSGMDTSAAGIGRTTSQMKDQDGFPGWDFTNIWAIDSKNDGYPYLENNQP